MPKNSQNAHIACIFVSCRGRKLHLQERWFAFTLVAFEHAILTDTTGKHDVDISTSPASSAFAA